MKEAGCPSGGLNSDPDPLVEPAPVVVPKSHVVVAVLDDLGECGVDAMRWQDEWENKESVSETIRMVSVAGLLQE